MNRLRILPAVVLTLSALAVAGAQTQEDADPPAKAVSPVESVALLAERLEIAGHLIDKLLPSNKSRTAELLPSWQVQLMSATRVLDGLSGAIEATEAAIEENKEISAELAGEELQLARTTGTRLTENLDELLLQRTVLEGAVEAFKEQLKKAEDDSAVQALVKSREARNAVDEQLKTLREALERLSSGKIDPVEKKND